MSTGLYCPWFYIQLRDNNGDPLSNGVMETYENKSTIPKPVWSDVDLLNPLPNPVPLDSAGVVPRFFLTSGSYTITFKDRFGNVLASADDIIGLGGESSTSAYILPIASSTVLGGVKISGNGLAIDGNGVLSVLPTSAQTISLSAYATLSGSNFSGSVTSPTFSANSISAISYSTSSITITEKNSILKVTGNSNYYQDCGISFGLGDAATIKSVEGVLQLGSEDSYGTFIGSNFYITSANLIVGDPSVANNLGEKSLILNQQLQSNYRAIFNSSAFILDKFKNKTLSTDSTGQLIGYDIGSVKLDNTDPVLGYFKSKVLPGAGIKFTEITDPTLGKVVSINSTANSWRKQTNVNTNYTVTDNDDTICVQGYATVTLPNPSVDYRGRIVTVLGVIEGISWNVNSLGNITGNTETQTDYNELTCKCVFDGTIYKWIVKKI